MTTHPMTSSAEMEREALELAKANGESDKEISRVFWFPSEQEIRLLVVDATTALALPGERLAPFYFGADPRGGIMHRSAIAGVAPEDVRKAAPPEGWGSWDEAQLIWRR